MEKVSLDEGFKLANQGVVVVGGLQVAGGHGHVIADAIQGPRYRMEVISISTRKRGST